MLNNITIVIVSGVPLALYSYMVIGEGSLPTSNSKILGSPENVASRISAW